MDLKSAQRYVFQKEKTVPNQQKELYLHKSKKSYKNVLP